MHGQQNVKISGVKHKPTEGYNNYVTVDTKTPKTRPCKCIGGCINSDMLYVADEQTPPHCFCPQNLDVLNSSLESGNFIIRHQCQLSQIYAFCHNCTLMCSVRVSEHTRIISLYSIPCNKEWMCALWGGNKVSVMAHVCRLSEALKACLIVTKSALFNVLLTMYRWSAQEVWDGPAMLHVWETDRCI